MSRYFALMTAVLSLGFLMACDPGPWDAPPFAEIDDIEDIQVPWTACRIDPLTGNTSTPGCENDPPVILPLNVLVRNARTQEPLNNVRIWYASGYHLIYLLPQEVLEAVDLPGTERWEYLEERGDVFAEFSGSFDGDYRPTYHEGWTNSNGISTIWLYVEEMPTDDAGQAKESGIVVSIGVDTVVVKLGTAA